MKRLSFIFSFALILSMAGVSHAATLPTFPSCLNPQGTVKSTYSNGTHGIVGTSNSYSGSDTVYNVLGNSVTQCFCGSNGEGIQTNWFDASSLTEQEIQDLKNDGWTQVPNGLAWGLGDHPYLAKNTNYSCSTSRVGGDSSSRSGDTTSRVLGLATTGNGVTVLLSGFGALFAIVLARRLRRNGK